MPPLSHTKLAHDSRVLLKASIERIMDARSAVHNGQWVIGMYLSGLAVECVLQAIVGRHDPRHDARHDLTQWLKRCPTSLQDALTSPPLRDQWNILAARWYNGMRYLSEDGMLGYLRDGSRARRQRWTTRDSKDQRARLARGSRKRS
ncbi:MAG TPA: hypothetical protein VGM03_14860 [Phycisphaerae bacterium]|jgi:hypothetical protein